MESHNHSPQTSVIRNNWLHAIILLLLTVAALLPTETGEFLLLDDNEYVTENPFVLGGLSWRDIVWAFTHVHSGHWHPLTWISLMIDVEFFGLNPFAMRVENVVLHGVSAVLLCFAFRSLTGSIWLSLFVSAVFAVHPLRLESVLWISQRKDVLAMLGFSAAFACHARYLSSRQQKWWWLSGIALTLGLLAKPTLVVAPVLLFLTELFLVRQGTSLKQALLNTAPFLVLSIGAALAAVLGQDAAGGLKRVDVLGWEARFGNMAAGYVMYLGKLFWPAHLGVFYPLRPLPSGLGIGALVTLLALTSFFLMQRHRRPYLIFGWAWFLIALLPMSGIVQVGWQQVADRWSYLAHVGLVFAVASLATEIFGENRRFLAMSGVLIVFILAFETRMAVPTWLTSVTLFEKTLEVAPDNFFISTNLGVAYEKKGLRREAITQYQEAIRVNPLYPLALNNMGSILAQEGRIADAVPYFSRALSAAPHFVPARYHMGLAYANLQQPSAALREWALLLALDPFHSAAREGFLRTAEAVLARGCDGTWGEMVSPGLASALREIKEPGLEQTISRLKAQGCAQ